MTNLKDKLSQMIAVAKKRVFFSLERVEGYEDVHEDILLDDFIANPKAVDWRYGDAPQYIALVESLILAVEALSGISISDELWDLARVDGVPDDFMVRAISAKDLRKIREALAEIKEKMK